MAETSNISAITGIANRVGDHRKPTKNHAPNPENWWSSAVLFPSGWRPFSRRGEAAINAELKAQIEKAGLLS